MAVLITIDTISQNIGLQKNDTKLEISPGGRGCAMNLHKLLGVYSANPEY